ncbi:MAG: AAA family ATPase [Pseudomonadota bacterium]
MEKLDNNQITKNDAPVYFLDLTVENVRCFGKLQTLDLSYGNGKQARWTILLGDNGTGKTTLLQCLVGKGRTFYRNDTAYNHINKHLTDNKIEELIIYAYGASRRMGSGSLEESYNPDHAASLFSENVSLINAVEWLLQHF